MDAAWMEATRKTKQTINICSRMVAKKNYIYKVILPKINSIQLSKFSRVKILLNEKPHFETPHFYMRGIKMWKHLSLVNEYFYYNNIEKKPSF